MNVFLMTRIVADDGTLGDVRPPYIYTREVREELSRHGLRPRADTPPQQVRDAVRDLYKHEIKVLKQRLLQGEFMKTEYAGQVIELRKRYPLLSIPTELWTERQP
jgi:hypothetical protein